MTPNCGDIPNPSLGDRRSIGLSFSGGGYRATAFSLGTMALLQDLKLLNKARVMSSVSGGSLALGAFICAKAGARLDKNKESEFKFYNRLWDPLMLALGNEGLADAFVRLPLLLQGEKWILHAADATQAFLSSLLGQEASLGNEAIMKMLREPSLSPDYVFFNAANISSLNLFRFGIQRGTPPEGDAMAEGDVVEPVYVLNRYYLRKAKENSAEAKQLYRYAGDLRLGDCVAASFAVPGGFEPMIFPDDYFRDDHYKAGREEAVRVRDQFRKTLICDRLKYVALLDGGLYDNLGLASVEAIRQFLMRRTRNLIDRKEPSQKPERADGTEQAAETEWEQPIHYVIATDVDNIQPAVGSYQEPSLDRMLEKTCAGDRSAGLSRRGRRRPVLPWGNVLRTLLGLGVVPLLSVLGLVLLLGMLLGGALWAPTIIWSLLPKIVLVVLVIALLGLVAGTRWLRRTTARVGRWLRHLFEGGQGPGSRTARPSTWLQNLGFSADFDRQGIDNNRVSWLLRAGLGVLRGPDRAKRRADLRAATLERRVGPLVPAFNGFLKRTRSLTYGYLQQTYGNGYSQHQPGPEPRCHLIRNMIFELIPGPDVDPDYAANLITLPLQDYRRYEDVEPQAPIMRKLSHADYVRDLLLERYKTIVVAPGRLPLQLLDPNSEFFDHDLCDSIEQLNLTEAATLWTWLTKSLELHGEVPRDEVPRDATVAEPDPTIRDLVVRVRGLLIRAMAHAGLPDSRFDERLSQRCTIKLGEAATSESWIPLVCEMATNLTTTLWMKGYRWYRLNKLDEEENRIDTTGGWFVEMPTGMDDSPLLDLGEMDAPAAAITALAGYLSTCFNLLEFFYASLGSSPMAHEFLVDYLIKENVHQWERAHFQDLKNLPYILRIATYNELRRRSRFEYPLIYPGIEPGKVNLLEPWLTIREGFPDSWRQAD